MELKGIVEHYRTSRQHRTQQKHCRCFDVDITQYHGIYLQFELWHNYKEETNFKGEPVTIIIDTGRWLPTEHTLKWMALIHGK